MGQAKRKKKKRKETKVKLYKLMEKCGEKKLMAQSTTPSIKQVASVMAASETGTLAFIDDFTVDGSNRLYAVL